MHISSLGDGFREAPNAELIEPKVEKYAELIKYKMFDLNITEADIHIMEDSSITRLQVVLQELSLFIHVHAILALLTLCACYSKPTWKWMLHVQMSYEYSESRI